MEYKKILMVTMSLDIGGAETHIVELSKALAAQGLEVIIASNGGVYCDTLAQYGIKHYKVPLHNKDPRNMLKSYQALKRILREEHIDIIHAHARIPGFICGILSRQLDLPFVTTCHGTYSLKGISRYVTNWGQKSLAVSNDIKDYLTQNYHVPEQNVLVTINGIDTTAFSSKTMDPTLEKELGLRPDAQRILLLGRMNTDAAAGYAAKIMELYPTLRQKHPHLQFILVGDGPLFPQLKAQAEQVNQSCGAGSIVMTGGRTDIPRLLNAAHGVVALSRAALEAMSCERPVILAGSYGYLGLFDESKLEPCRETNFTARGFAEPNGGFAADLEELLSMEEEKRQALGRYGRSVVGQYYSAAAMAKDARTIYDRAWTIRPTRPYDYCLIGYYGYSNSGDDALLTAIIHNLRQCQPHLSLCVMTNRPEECAAEFQVTTVHRFHPLAVLRALRRSKALIFGGGNLIQDVTSAKSLLYYLFILGTAQRMGLKTMLYANGIGPLTTQSSLNQVQKILRRVDVITLREESSYQFLQQHHIKAPVMEITADETLTMDLPFKEATRQVLEAEGVDPDRPYFCVSVRPWKESPADFVESLAKSLDQLAEETGAQVVLLPLHQSADTPLCQEVMSHMTHPACCFHSHLGAQQLIGVSAGAIFMMGMRLHALIYGTAGAAPVMGLSYDEKVTSFLRSMENPHCIPIHEVTTQNILHHAHEILNHLEEERTRAEQARIHLREKAQCNCSYALQLLKRD